MFPRISGLLVDADAEKKTVCLNWVYFTLKSLPLATESPVRTSSIGLCRFGRDPSIELGSCLSAEEVYLLDKRTSIKIESFVNL